MGIQMEIFKAASGREVKVNVDGSLLVGKALGYLSREAAFDAEEFFRAKRDAELGRWRWPENPDYVVYPTSVPSRVRVMRENGIAELEWVGRSDTRPYEFCHAARAYFEAHPEPKPWHDAKPGEVWLLTVDGHEAHFVADGKDFNGTNEFGRFICCAHDDCEITAGRRIWPEVAS